MLDLIPHCSFQHWRCCFGLLCLVPLGSLWLGSFQLSSAPPQGQPQVTLGCTRVPFCCLSHWCCFHSPTSQCLSLGTGEGDGHRRQRMRSAGLIPATSLMDKVMQFQGHFHFFSPWNHDPQQRCQWYKTAT